MSVVILVVGWSNPERLRQLMRDAMVRNTRAVVALKLRRRHAVTIRVDGSQSEQAAYQELTAATRRLAAEGANHLVLRHLLGAAGSSPAAAAAAVKRFRERRGDEPFWHALAQRWASVGTGGKEAALLELLRRNPDEKKLIFAHYRETLDHLAGLLAREGFAFANPGRSILSRPATIKPAIVLAAVNDKPFGRPQEGPSLTAAARGGQTSLRSGRKNACGAVEQKNEVEREDQETSHFGRRLENGRMGVQVEQKDCPVPNYPQSAIAKFL
jgi:hypothetical protein